MAARASRRPAGCLTLAQYIRAILGLVRTHDPTAYARILQVVGNRRAHIVVGGERVLVGARPGRVTVRAAVPPRRPLSTGLTTRRTVLRLLDGYLEASAALLSGELELMGTIGDVTRMATAIEIVLDASTRIPELPKLAQVFRGDPCHPTEHELWRGPVPRTSLTASTTAELALLARLGLLPATITAEPA